MPRLQTTVKISYRQAHVLEMLMSKRSLPQGLGHRALILLKTSAGMGSKRIGEEMGISKTTVLLWRDRWKTHYESLCDYEASIEEGKEGDNLLGTRIIEILTDEQRSGKPRDFTEAQDMKIVALACEAPMKSSIPQTHWTHESIAAEAARRGIVKSISSSQVGRILKKDGIETT